MKPPYSIRKYLAAVNYSIIAYGFRDQDLKNLAKEIRVQAFQDNPKLLAEAQLRFKEFFFDRYLRQ